MPASENLGLGQLGSGPVRFELAGKTDALGMVAAMAERHASGGVNA